MEVTLTLNMTKEDAERFLRAFRDGQLADLGIIDVSPPLLHSSEKTDRAWVTSENERRDARQEDNSPLPS